MEVSIVLLFMFVIVKSKLYVTDKIRSLFYLSFSVCVTGVAVKVVGAEKKYCLFYLLYFHVSKVSRRLKLLPGTTIGCG